MDELKLNGYYKFITKGWSLAVTYPEGTVICPYGRSSNDPDEYELQVVSGDTYLDVDTAHTPDFQSPNGAGAFWTYKPSELAGCLAECDAHGYLKPPEVLEDLPAWLS